MQQHESNLFARGLLIIFSFSATPRNYNVISAQFGPIDNYKHAL